VYKIKHLLENTKLRKTRRNDICHDLFQCPIHKAFENYIGKSLDGPSLELLMYWLKALGGHLHMMILKIRCEASLEYNVTSKLQ
jgi:hypothetical protein